MTISTDYQILTAAIKGFDKQVKAHEDGIKPLHRSDTYRKTERSVDKIMKKQSWYKNWGLLIYNVCPPNTWGKYWPMRSRR